MSQSSAPQHSEPRRPSPSRPVSVVLWVLQVLLALVFLAEGIFKLAGAEMFVQTFEAIGFGQWLRYLTGVLEVAGALGLLVPRLSGLAALGLACVMIGAIGTHLFLISGSVVLPVILLLLLAAVAWGRRGRTLALIGR